MAATTTNEQNERRGPDFDEVAATLRARAESLAKKGIVKDPCTAAEQRDYVRAWRNAGK